MLLDDMGIDSVKALTYAKLPLDLFNRNDAKLPIDEYFRLWRGIEQAANNKDVALLFAKYVTTESFDAPIFSALCCDNLNMALQRLSHYKPLIGPMELNVSIGQKETRLQLLCADFDSDMPNALCMSEAVFFTQLARIGTRNRICPTLITVPVEPKFQSAYHNYFGCDVVQGHHLAMTFNTQDAKTPFLTASGEMWNFFEEKLNKQLEMLTADSSTSERVKSILTKSLPSGEANIEFVAAKLAVSKRTLQRQLTEEAETFQSLLSSVREELAKHYLNQSEISLGEISYLLGFKEQNSFIRAFSSWQGISPSIYRQKNNH